MINWNDYFVYDESSPSCLRWISGKMKGQCVMNQNAGGWYRVRVLGKLHFAHRIIYELCFSKIPEGCVVDHIDGNPSNNLAVNLRVITPTVNRRNSKATKGRVGVTGVHKEEHTERSGFVSTLYRATWYELSGKKRTKSFSTLKYGEELAQFMAEEYRDLMIRKLNLQGAGYTERHGK